MNLYKITHYYSFAGNERYLQSPMGFVDMWNYIKILQNITWDIDSSHNLSEEDVVTIMAKFYDAQRISPSKTQKKDCTKIDLYENWESGYANERGGRTILRDQTEAMIEKYNFYKPGLYSFMLSLFLKEHEFGEGTVGANESIFCDNQVWEVLFLEGVYDRERFLAEQQIRPEYLEKCKWEKQRRERETLN